MEETEIVAEEPVKRKRGRPRKEKPPKEKREWNMEEFQNWPKATVKDGAMLFAPSNKIMTDEELDSVTMISPMNRLYSSDTDRSDKITMINAKAIENRYAGERVNLRDTEQVDTVIRRYRESCLKNNSLALPGGMAKALGITKEAMRIFRKRHPDHPTTELLDREYAQMESDLLEAALCGATNPVYTMFLLKSIFNYRENAPIEAEQENILPEATTTAELMEKYAMIDSDE